MNKLVSKIAVPMTAILLMTTLTGCIAGRPLTCKVSEIGARALHGEAQIPKGAKQVEVQIADSETSTGPNGRRYCSRWRPAPYQLSYPLSRSAVGGDGSVVVVADREKGWKYSYGSKVKLNYQGQEMEFKVRKLYDFKRKTEGTLIVEHPYRRWYGYPAQGLMVVAVPVDMAMNALICGVGTPVVLVKVVTGNY